MSNYFICNWDKETPQKTWSGTCYSLRKALGKREHWTDLTVDHRISLWHRFCNKIHCYVNDLEKYSLIFWKKRITPHLKNGDNIIQFAEYAYKKGVNSYLYCDVTTEYCLFLKQNNPRIFNLSNFFGRSKYRLKKRAKYQNNYFRHNCAGILCMGHWLVNWLVNEAKIPANKVYYVGGGANLQIPDFIPNRKGNKLLFIGIDFERKGGYSVIEAFKIAKQKKHDLELYIIGPKINPLSEQIEGVFFEGQKNHDELSEYYQKCDVFVLPSYFEAYGLVFIEALCFGLPCIGRDCYEMPYFIEEGITGALVPKEDDHNYLAEKMLLLLSENQYKLNVAGKKEFYQKEYSWETVANRITCILHNNQKVFE